MARVFKDRYYPDTHVLQTPKGQDAIFIWMGICEARDALCKGFKWVLGDG